MRQTGFYYVKANTLLDAWTIAEYRPGAEWWLIGHDWPVDSDSDLAEICEDQIANGPSVPYRVWTPPTYTIQRRIKDCAGWEDVLTDYDTYPAANETKQKMEKFYPTHEWRITSPSPEGD